MLTSAGAANHPNVQPSSCRDTEGVPSALAATATPVGFRIAVTEFNGCPDSSAPLPKLSGCLEASATLPKPGGFPEDSAPLPVRMDAAATGVFETARAG